MTVESIQGAARREGLVGVTDKYQSQGASLSRVSLNGGAAEERTRLALGRGPRTEEEEARTGTAFREL